MAENCNDAGASSDNLKICNDNFLCGVVEGFYGRPWTPEQRRDLFMKMKKFGLNTYMYAPKDDFKHRAYWRELYTVEEAEHLTTLIQASKESNITFFYALSPGLDISYSNPKEIAALKRKLEQVSQFGCNAFALLFDDIEPEISETDKEVYQSFAHAQVSVANEMYQHLNQPKFIFCPTEYCAARAIPNVQNSEYLNTVGQKLHPSIDIMWTGPKVISKIVSIESIQELSEVLHRPPLIWDNLHANDYDQKRLFLGPYCGRSTELIPLLRGVLTNPNCEYETNFIPIHTLAEWSKCNADGKRDLTLNDSVTADIKLESENENGSVEDIPSHIGPNTYHPKKALKVAMSEWLEEFYMAKNAYGRAVSAPFVPTPIPACPPPVVNTCLNSTLPTPSASQSGLASPSHLNPMLEVDSTFQPLSTDLTNSLVATPALVETKEYSSTEPMDCNPSPSSSPKHSASITDGNSASDSESKGDGSAVEAVKDVDGAEEMQTEPIENSSVNGDDAKQLTFNDISLLVDLFYLPFEHGRQGLQFLQEFYWLKTHGHLLSESRRKKPSDVEAPEVQEWYNRASKFDSMTQAVGKLLMHLTFCPNRSLLYDLYPYVWDIKGVISLLNSYVKWIALGRVPMPVTGFMSPPFTWFSKGYKEAFMSGDQEPWVFLGGLTAELQHMLPLESVSDLFLYKPPEPPTNRVYTIRPYLPSDEAAVYNVCRKTCDDGLDGSEVFPEYPDLIGDKLVGNFLCLSPEYCFVVEDESGICGYALAALDAKQLQKKSEVSWIPHLLTKYPAPKKENGEMLTPAENSCGNGPEGHDGLKTLAVCDEKGNSCGNGSEGHDGLKTLAVCDEKGNSCGNGPEGHDGLKTLAVCDEKGEIISALHNQHKLSAPDVVYQHHPSILRMNVLSTVGDPSVPKRMLTCILSTLKANGSHGVFCEVTVGDKNIVEFFSKLGFLEIALPGFTCEDVFYMGRTF